MGVLIISGFILYFHVLLSFGWFLHFHTKVGSSPRNFKQTTWRSYLIWHCALERLLLWYFIACVINSNITWNSSSFQHFNLPTLPLSSKYAKNPSLKGEKLLVILVNNNTLSNELQVFSSIHYRHLLFSVKIKL